MCYLTLLLSNIYLLNCKYRQVSFYARGTFLKKTSHKLKSHKLNNCCHRHIYSTTSGHTDLQSIYVLCVQYVYISIQYTGRSCFTLVLCS